MSSAVPLPAVRATHSITGKCFLKGVLGLGPVVQHSSCREPKRRSGSGLVLLSEAGSGCSGLEDCALAEAFSKEAAGWTEDVLLGVC